MNSGDICSPVDVPSHSAPTNFVLCILAGRFCMIQVAVILSSWTAPAIEAEKSETFLFLTLDHQSMKSLRHLRRNLTGRVTQATPEMHML